MAKLRTRPWKTEDHLKTPADVAAYLEAVFEDGDPELINFALGAVARSKGMTGIARQTGLGRQSLYKALSPSGRPEFATVLKVVNALGLTLTVVRERPGPARPRRIRTGRKSAKGRSGTAKDGKRLGS